MKESGSRQSLGPIGIVLLGILFGATAPVFIRYNNYIAALCLAVFCTFGSHSIFTWSVKYISPTLLASKNESGCTKGMEKIQ